MARKPTGEDKRQARISLLFTQTLYDKVVLLADSQGQSVNNFVEGLLEKAVEKNSAVIDEFQSARLKAKQSYVESINAQ